MQKYDKIKLNAKIKYNNITHTTIIFEDDSTNIIGFPNQNQVKQLFK